VRRMRAYLFAVYEVERGFLAGFRFFWSVEFAPYIGGPRGPFDLGGAPPAFLALVGEEARFAIVAIGHIVISGHNDTP
jgi:hypothetical protein